MSTYSYRLRTSPTQPSAASSTIPLEWFSDESGNIQARHDLSASLASNATLELFHLAAAVYCADRLSPRPAEWARDITIEFPVHDPGIWSDTSPLAETLSFLSGDNWELRPFAAPAAKPRRTHAPIASFDAACLFSGGLDSFAGAIHLLESGQTVCLVSHYEGGQTPSAQTHLYDQLRSHYGPDRVSLRRIFLRPATTRPGQKHPLGKDRESSTRSRSLLFLASGLLVANGAGSAVPLVIPENGFIGINVPLTAARSGSLSTRTTHPHFMASLGNALPKLGITNSILNPYRHLTKGEMLAQSPNPGLLARLAASTLSCAHPETARYARRPQGNCGYCFPCLIRRGSMHHVGLDHSTDYAYDIFTELDQLAGHRGADLRALTRSLAQTSNDADILRNGPVPVADLRAFARTYQRGRSELQSWLTPSKDKPKPTP
jgi:7-cyano-7-deazaguanine synthase in queuosine biosynthesis